MLKSTMRSLLLASAVAAVAGGTAYAQDQAQPQSQPAQATPGDMQAQPVASPGDEQQQQAQPMQTQYAPQGQNGAQPIGNASPNEAAGGGLPVDQVSNVQGTQVACSGIGKGDETNPEFADLPVKFSLVGGYGQWLGNETLSVSSRSGGQNISVQCSGPWVLMKLDPGRYSVTADVPDAGSKTVSFSVPSSGAREVTIRFPQATQGQSNYHATQSPTTSGT